MVSHTLHKAFARALLNAVAARDGAVTTNTRSHGTSEAEAIGPVTADRTRASSGHPRRQLGTKHDVLRACSWRSLDFRLPSHSRCLTSALSLLVYQLSSSIFWVMMALPHDRLGRHLLAVPPHRLPWFHGAVDDEGLTVRRARGRPHERRILWSDTRGFAQVIYYHRSALPHYAYILDGETSGLSG